jgi:hypothetical protein
MLPTTTKIIKLLRICINQINIVYTNFKKRKACRDMIAEYIILFCRENQVVNDCGFESREYYF